MDYDITILQSIKYLQDQVSHLNLAFLKIAQNLDLEDEKNSLLNFVPDLKINSQISEIQKSNLTFVQAMTTEATRSSNRLKLLEQDIKIVRELKEDTQRLSKLEETLKQQILENVSQINVKISNWENKTLQLYREITNCNEQVKDKLSIKDIGKITLPMRTEFIQKTILQQELEKLHLEISKKLELKCNKSQLKEIEGEMLDLSQKIIQKVSLQIQSQLENNNELYAKMFATKLDCEQQQIMFDFNIQKISNEVSQITKEFNDKIEREGLKINHQINQDIVQLKRKLKEVEDIVKILKFKDDKKEEEYFKDQLMVTQIFNQIQARYPDRTMEIKQLKVELDDVFEREQRNHENTLKFREITEKQLQTNLNQLANKLDKETFTNFQFMVEQTYFSSLKAAEQNLRIINLENQLNSNNTSMEFQEKQIQQLFERADNFNDKLDLISQDQYKDTCTKYLYISQLYIKGNTIKKLQEEFICLKEKQVDYLPKQEYYNSLDKNLRYYQKQLKQQDDSFQGVQLIYIFVLGLKSNIFKYFESQKQFYQNTISTTNQTNFKQYQEDNSKFIKLVLKQVETAITDIQTNDSYQMNNNSLHNNSNFSNYYISDRRPASQGSTMNQQHFSVQQQQIKIYFFFLELNYNEAVQIMITNRQNQ